MSAFDAVDGSSTDIAMSAFGYKRTLSHTLNYVRFTPQSGHWYQSTFAATASTSIFSSGRASPLMTRSVAPGL